MTSYLMAIVMFALSLTIYEKFAANKIKIVWSWKYTRRRKTGLVLVPFCWKWLIPYRWFFPQNLSYLGTYIYAKRYAHTHSERQGVIIRKICKAQLPKTVLPSAHCYSHCPVLSLNIFFNIIHVIGTPLMQINCSVIMMNLFLTCTISVVFDGFCMKRLKHSTCSDF